MATLVLTTVGTLVGGPIGGAIGAVIGQAADQAILAPRGRQGPRLGDLSVQTSSYGSAIPKLFGTIRVAGTIIWSTDLIEHPTTSGGKGQGRTTHYNYSASFAVALSGRRVRAVRRIWADGNLLRGAAGDFKVPVTFRLHDGDEDQAPDALIVAAEGAGHAPAFRGTAYAVFEDFALADYGNRIPSLTFEVEADEGPMQVPAIAAALGGGFDPVGDGPALGGFAAGGDSLRGALEQLAGVSGLVLADDGGALRLRKPGGTPVTLDADEMLSGRTIRHGAAGVRPAEVAVTYHDAGRDYQAGLQRARSGGPVPEGRVERIALPALLTADAAKGLAEARLATLEADRSEADVAVTWRAGADIVPGGLVRLPSDARTWRVRNWRLEAMAVRLGLVRHGAASVPAAADPGRPTREPDRIHGPTILRLIAMPDPGAQPVMAVLAAGTHAGWRRASLSASFDQGVSWSDAGATAVPAILGHCPEPLPDGQAALLDLRSRIEVLLPHDSMILHARDDDALAAGANLARIGDEWLQFGGAEPLGDGRWRLSRLLRGRRGSEWAMASHGPDEPFAVIEDAATKLLALPAGFPIGGGLTLLASGVGDEAPVAAAAVVDGEGLRPPAPVHARMQVEQDGDLILTWTRRSRQGWSWPDGADSPLGEESELYRLTITGAAGTREVERGESRWTYDAAARAADGPGPVSVAIRQVGTHGPSRPLTVIIS